MFLEKKNEIPTKKLGLFEYPKISQATKLVFRVKTKDPILNISSIFILKKTRQHSDFVKALTVSVTLNIEGISF